MVVTIVVLLILAGVSISLILDNNGIIQKSKDAKREYGQAKENEQADLSNISDFIDDAIAEPMQKVDVDSKATANGTINGEKGSSSNPVIPEGYTPINTETSEWGDGTSSPTQDSVDHGLVIKDDDNNEWVWIPVPDVTVMCDISNKTEYRLCDYDRAEGEIPTTTKLYSKTTTIGKDNTKEVTRINPGEINELFREPDLAGDDLVEIYYKDILGFQSVEDMAKTFVNEYKEMIDSIRRYGGFYIGRYELSAEGVKKDQPTLRGKNWYEFYQICKLLNASAKVETRMIWGIQWDVTCDFIANKGETKDIKDSSSWGNYKSSTKQNTGSNENWKANNIYDLAGNCAEYTQEATYGVRTMISSYYQFSGDGFSVLRRSNCQPSYTQYVNEFLRYSSNLNNKIKTNLTHKEKILMG